MIIDNKFVTNTLYSRYRNFILKLSEILTVIVVCDIAICIQELGHTLKMFDAAGLLVGPCSHVTNSGTPGGREHVKSLTQYSDLKKFKILIGRVEEVVKDTKSVKAQFLGKQLVADTID